jgi:histidinol-phosphate aminotransferase
MSFSEGPVAKSGLRELVVYKPGKPIEELSRELKLKEVYKLASNENPFPPLYIKKAILKELENINRYPEADCFYLRKILAKKLRVNQDQIVFGNGSDEIIVLALRGFLNEGEEVIVGFPTFLIYEIQSRVQGAKIKRVPFKNYRYDLEAIVKAITSKTKIIFIANPDNPHGTYLTHQEVKDFLHRIPERILILFDEAYFEFVDRTDFPHSLEILKKRRNIIISRTFSKAYSLAGLRIGYGVTTPQIARILNKVREPFNVDRIAQVSAICALKNTSFLKKVKKHIKKEKAYLYKELNKLNLEFVESVTNFILVNFKQDTKVLYRYLLKKGVIIRELGCWGLKNFFRVTVGLHKANRRFILSLKEFLGKSKPKPALEGM